jgi:hypothetical protein
MNGQFGPNGSYEHGSQGGEGRNAMVEVGRDLGRGGASERQEEGLMWEVADSREHCSRGAVVSQTATKASQVQLGFD